MPDWVTHILNVRDGTASAIPFVSNNFPDPRPEVIQKLPITPVPPRKHKVGEIVVDMKDVNVTYGTRKVTNYRSSKAFLMVPSGLRFSRTLPGK